MNEDIKFLKELQPNWYENHETTWLVAAVLNGFGVFKDCTEVISFFKVPWYWKITIEELIKTEK